MNIFYVFMGNEFTSIKETKTYLVKKRLKEYYVHSIFQTFHIE